MFNSYNIDAFGKKLKQIRTELRLTQKEVCERIGLSNDGLRRIENGYVIPRYDTLIKMSAVYKRDLIILMHHLTIVPVLQEYYEKVQDGIDNNNLDYIREIKDRIRSDFDFLMMEQVIEKVEIDQFVTFCEASMIFIQNDKERLHDVQSKIIEGLKLTIPTFKIKNIKRIKFNPFEMRFLHLYALASIRLRELETSRDILLKLIEIQEVEPVDVQSIKNKILLFYSTSYTFYEMEDHANALKYADEGIALGIEFMRYNELHMLYYRKGIAEYFLGLPDYLSPLKTSVVLLEISNKKLADLYRKVTLEKYNIEI